MTTYSAWRVHGDATNLVTHQTLTIALNTFLFKNQIEGRTYGHYETSNRHGLVDQLEEEEFSDPPGTDPTLELF